MKKIKKVEKLVDTLKAYIETDSLAYLGGDFAFQEKNGNPKRGIDYFLDIVEEILR